MPPKSSNPGAPVALVFGDDEFMVKQRARELYEGWRTQLGGMDHEIIDAAVNNSGEALRALAKLRQALQTLPFFGGAKAIWFQNCAFLGDERAASTAAVTENLGELAAELKAFPWDNVRLLISAGKVDKRKTFYKTIEKLGTIENYAAWSTDDRDWADKAELLAREKLRGLGKTPSGEALAELVASVGPNARQLHNEVEKLALFTGDRAEVSVEDVTAVVSRNKQARAFAVGEALGDRDLPRLLQALDEELWEMKFDSKKSEIGLLYGLISKIRVLIFLKEMVEGGWLKPESDHYRFKSQLDRIPADLLPEDRRLNPLTQHPYILFKAMPQITRYSRAELARAMDRLLQCNLRLVSGSQDDALVLQRALIEIVGTAGRPRAAARN